MNDLPRFAVVGHPNKGKSSIVATLAQNDGIAIALEPGTTRNSDVYPLRVDGETLYELIDTPGFQRPRQALEWMQAQSRAASDRPDTVRAFVIQHAGEARFHDECELLRPIIDGAGILYVVDGSVPYSSENEAEME
ncbi:MAG: GTPase domain-containing protein, partial [Rhodanobacter sp.]